MAVSAVLLMRNQPFDARLTQPWHKVLKPS
jgi:hypothetical protein